MESILKSAVAEAALQDQFQQSCQKQLDGKHLQEMNLDKAATRADMYKTKKILTGKVSRGNQIMPLFIQS